MTINGNCQFTYDCKPSKWIYLIFAYKRKDGKILQNVYYVQNYIDKKCVNLRKKHVTDINTSR